MKQEKKKRVNRGKDFENEIKERAEKYARAGILTLSKTDPPLLQVGPGRIIRLRNPFLDFVGAWTLRGGRAIFMEAKSVDGERLRVDGKEGSGGIDERQMESLRRWHRAGAVACLIFKANQGMLMFKLEALENVYKALGKKFVTYNEALAFGPGLVVEVFDMKINTALTALYPAIP